MLINCFFQEFIQILIRGTEEKSKNFQNIFLKKINNSSNKLNNKIYEILEKNC